MRIRPLPRLLGALALLALPSACSETGGAAPIETGSAGGGEGGGNGGGEGGEPTGTLPLGSACETDGECATGMCLKSEYGPPWCSWGCAEPQVPCDLPEGSVTSSSLCVRPDDVKIQNPDSPDFKGPLSAFCVPTCDDLDECLALNASWEICEAPKHLGDLIYPQLGENKGTCQAPTFQGKDPVDPKACDWEKTIEVKFTSEANLCKTYCAYLLKCNAIPPDTDPVCCEWGCYKDMVVGHAVVDDWHDKVKCFIDEHGAWPDIGEANSCSEPPEACCAKPSKECTVERVSGVEVDVPPDPTPVAVEREDSEDSEDSGG